MDRHTNRPTMGDNVQRNTLNILGGKTNETRRDIADP